MKARLVFLVTAALLAGAAPAQAQRLIYIAAGPTGYWNPDFARMWNGQAVAGGELALGRRAGLGAEVGFSSSPEGGFVTMSVNGIFYFARDVVRGSSPFVLAGIGMFHNPEVGVGAITLGAGVNTWVKPRVGVRLELRDYIVPGDRVGHVWSLRAGVVFRFGRPAG